MSALPAPQSVQDVEQLVKTLYSPGPSSMIVAINDQLQKLQLSEDGWKLADALMASEDPNVRFFAALTFTVKLNNDGPSLDAETAQTVQMRLLYWLVRLVGQGESGLVCKKLCSTLTTYFIQSPLQWESPLLHLSLCFHEGDVIAANDVNDRNAGVSDLFPSLNALQLTALLWFAGDLAEEVGRVDSNAQAHARLHIQMEHTVKDASALMSWTFRQSHESSSTQARAAALGTFLTWVNYAQPVWPRKPEALQYLRDLIGQASRCLIDRELFQEALDIFRDILESYTSFFKPEHMEMLARIIHDYVRPKLLQALFERESDGQHVLYGQFIIAYGDANIQQVVEESKNELGSQAIVKLHLDMITAEGYPGDDDQLSIQSIEFWNTYIEYVNDVLFSEGSTETGAPEWLPQAKSILKQAFQLLWKKMLPPPSNIAQEWGEEEREGFKDFRIDTADLFLSIFLLLGKDMLQQLVELTLQSLEAKHWQAVEASLFCLNALADNVLEDAANESIVQSVFQSPLYREIADFSLNLPTQTRRTAIDLLGSYGQYIERHAEFLPDALRFLFASLETPGLANPAAKSIASLCSTCRASLTNQIPDFLEQYQRFLDSNTSDSYTKEKVIGAIAAIVQALSPESSKVEPLLALLDCVDKDIVNAKQHAVAGEDDLAEVTGVTALECLASIGRGMQIPEDIPIDIYDDNDKVLPGTEYWESEQGRAVQQRIVGCFSALQTVGVYSAAIDAVCQTLRSGYTETVPGPFVLPPSVTVRFVQQCTIRTPQLESVLSTASMLIAQHSRNDSKRIDTEVKQIYDCVVTFVQALGQSKEDPALANACIDLCNRLIPHYAQILFTETTFPMLDFILSAIIGPDSLPKRAACEFSTKLFSTRVVKSNGAAPTTEIQQKYDETVATFGPKFAYCLMIEVGGLALRSELDFLCEPLKALLMHQSNARTWLQEGITSEMFPNPKITADDKVRFLRQLASVQSDGKKIKEVVKNFWAACRGTVLSYRS